MQRTAFSFCLFRLIEKYIFVIFLLNYNSHLGWWRIPEWDSRDVIHTWLWVRLAVDTSSCVFLVRFGARLVNLLFYWLNTETCAFDSLHVVASYLGILVTTTYRYCLYLITGGVMFAGRMRDEGYMTMLDPFLARFGKITTAILFVLATMSSIFYTSAIVSALGKYNQYCAFQVKDK